MVMNISPYVIAGLKDESELREVEKYINPYKWISATCLHMKIDFKVVNKKSRERISVYPRQLICYLLHTHSQLSLNEISRLMPHVGYDHTDVIHARDFIKSQLKIMDERTIYDIKEIEIIARAME
jgi:chromosomal replication initiation ATPase DnaA